MISGTRKALVIGASGFIGSHVAEVLRSSDWNAWGTYRHSPVRDGIPLDLSRAKDISELIERLHPDRVFLCAAESDVDFCEQHPQETALINVAAVEHLCRSMASGGAQLIFFSSDYVFDGSHGPYLESASVHPLCEYGRQKTLAEQLIRNRLSNHLILRVTVVYGWERQQKNFLERLLLRLGQGESTRVPNDQVGTPTLVNDVARTAVSLAERGMHGTCHVAGPDRLSRYRLGVEIALAFGFDPALVVGVPTAQLGQKAPRPLQSGLRSENLPPEMAQQMRSCREALPWLKDHPGSWPS